MLDEIYYLTKYFNINYLDIMHMPVFERKYFINKFIEEQEKKQNN